MRRGWLTTLASNVAMHLWRSRQPLLAYYLFFVGVAAAVLTPASTWTATVLLSSTGRLTVSNADLLAFLTSPAGLIWLLMAGTFAALILFIQHAGMILIAWNGPSRHPWSAGAALWAVVRASPRLFVLAAWQVMAHLALLLPFALGLLVAYQALIASYDLTYLVTARPPRWQRFVGLAVVLTGGGLVTTGWLYLRWSLALPALLLEGLRPRMALRRSVHLTRETRGRIAPCVLGLAGILGGLPVLLTVFFDTLGDLFFALLPERLAFVIPGIVVLLAGYIVLSVAITFLSVAINSLVLLDFYTSAVAAERSTVPRPQSAGPPATPPPGAGVIAWAGEIVILLVAFGSATHTIASFDLEDRVAITAHRGSSHRAPENTLSAITQAIADGADYVEIDVRETADGTVVLLHDSDLRRVAGSDKKIWEVRYEELQMLDVGGWFAPAFEGERIPTLREAIHTARGRVKLNIELKITPHAQRLPERVVRILHEEHFVPEALVTSYSYEALERVRQLDPAISIGFILFRAIGPVTKLPVDVLSLDARMATLPLIISAQRAGKQVHVWPVNKRSAMSRFIDLGVDNLITDRPDVLAELLRERSQLTDVELLLVKVRHWLWR